MNEYTSYFWVDGRVITDVRPDINWRAMHHHHGRAPCYQTTDGWQRYGYYTPKGYKELTLPQMPKAFRMALLLMGAL